MTLVGPIGLNYLRLVVVFIRPPQVCGALGGGVGSNIRRVTEDTSSASGARDSRDFPLSGRLPRLRLGL